MFKSVDSTKDTLDKLRDLLEEVACESEEKTMMSWALLGATIELYTLASSPRYYEEACKYRRRIVEEGAPHVLDDDD